MHNIFITLSPQILSERLLLAIISGQKGNFRIKFTLESITIYYIRFVVKILYVNIAFLIKIRWFYNLLYHCHKCSKKFIKKKYAIGKFGDLKHIVVGNLKNIFISNEWIKIKERIKKKYLNGIRKRLRVYWKVYLKK